jgi:hypothetical protein
MWPFFMLDISQCIPIEPLFSYEGNEGFSPPFVHRIKVTQVTVITCMKSFPQNMLITLLTLWICFKNVTYNLVLYRFAY